MNSPEKRQYSQNSPNGEGLKAPETGEAREALAGDSAMGDSLIDESVMARLRLVLVETRFPENIGGAARASANYGPCPLHLVKPERWDFAKALPMATAQGKPLLEKVQVHEDAAEAVAACSLVVGTTARTGGWRRQLASPREAAAEIAARLLDGEEVALMFGPEDRGLTNAHLEHCGRLVTIPTNSASKSLNLAQAILLLLYECHLALFGRHKPKGAGSLSRRATQEEKELLYRTLKEALLAVDYLQPDNPDYFFLPLARFFDRADLRRHEFDIFMGICRQIGGMKNRS